MSGGSRETTGLGWLQKTPLVSLLFAVAIAAVPFLLGEPPAGSGARFDDAREEARDYFVRNPALDVDSFGALVLDPVWLSEARAAGGDGASKTDLRLPPRLRLLVQRKAVGPRFLPCRQQRSASGDRVARWGRRAWLGYLY